MTVSTEESKITYNANGSTTVWGFPFANVDPTRVFLFITNSQGVITQVPAGQYTVNLFAPIPPNPTSIGGQVVYPLTPPALAPGNLLTIVRLLPDTQDTSIANQSIIYPPVIEQEFDYLTMIDQQLGEMIARSLKVSISDDPMPPLPPAALRANSQAVFDSNGNLVPGGAVVGTIISPVMIPVVTAPTLGLARNAMGAAGTDSPIFTGDPRAPSPPPADNDSSIATTQWVQNYVSINGGGAPSGTRMLFQQTTAPAGWTKDTTHNDKALRIVSGPVGSGGVTAFSTVFSKVSTDPFTLSVNEMPAHGHGVSDPTHFHSTSDPGHAHQMYESATGSVLNGQLPTAGADTPAVLSAAGVAVLPTTTGITIQGNFTGISIGGNGASLPHSHGIDTRVLYVDVIIAQKD